MDKIKSAKAYKGRSSRIVSLQSEISSINENINKIDSRKIEIHQIATDTQSELTKLTDDLYDIQRFQRFILEFTHNDHGYALPRAIEVLTSQIASKESLAKKLEGEDRSNDSMLNNLRDSLESKMREISTLQEQQAAYEKN